MGDIAIKVENLTKEYRLGTIGHGTLREDMQTAWARFRGKEDPNSLVTAKHNAESNEKHFLALDDLNFDIKKGDRVGIIGKNGAGKSTLLKILSRITSPTKGNIYIDGRIGSLLEVGTGFHPELTGRENIYLNGSIMGMKKWEIDKQLDAIIDFSGVEKFIDTPIKRYSSGMFVRLGFAVAAHLEPEILIVDEVLAVGDIEFQKKAISKMKDVSSSDGRTILFVSHNLASISKLCNTSLLLRNGIMLQHGRTVDVLAAYRNICNVAETTINIENNSQIISLEKVTVNNRTNNTMDHFFTSEDINLKIYLNVSKSEIDGYGIFAVKDIDQNYVLISYSSDINFSFRNLKLGSNLITIKLPKRILNQGTYLFSISINDLEGKKYCSAIDFQKVVISENDLVIKNRGGYISSILEWKDNNE